MVRPALLLFMAGEVPSCGWNLLSSSDVLGVVPVTFLSAPKPVPGPVRELLGSCPLQQKLRKLVFCRHWDLVFLQLEKRKLRYRDSKGGDTVSPFADGRIKSLANLRGLISIR